MRNQPEPAGTRILADSRSNGATAAEQYGVSIPSIRAIVDGTNWRDVSHDGLVLENYGAGYAWLRPEA